MHTQARLQTHTHTHKHLLSQEAHGCALVQQTQLAVGVLAVPWVPVNASVQQGAVEVAHLCVCVCMCVCVCVCVCACEFLRACELLRVCVWGGGGGEGSTYVEGHSCFIGKCIEQGKEEGTQAEKTIPRYIRCNFEGQGEMHGIA